MKKILNPGNFYIAFWMVALALGAIYSSRFTGLLRLFALIISAYYVFYANVKYKLPRFFTYLNLLLIMFTIYGLYYIIFGEAYYSSGDLYVKKSSYLVSIYSSLLPIYAFYVLTRQGWIKESNLRFWIVVFFIVAYVQFYFEGLWWIERAFQTGASLDDIRNNAGYLFVALLPCIVFYYNKPVIQFIAIGIIVVMLFSGLKRGAILTGSIAIIILVWNIIGGKNAKPSTGRLFITTFSFFVLIVAGYYYFNSLTKVDAFNSRMEQTLEGNTSGRDQITDKVIYHLQNRTTPIQKLFGSGARASVQYIGIEAHNDWFEIAMAHGLVGLLLFLLYWISFFKCYRKAKKGNKQSPEQLALLLLFIIFFLRTFFSMSYNSMPVYATCIMGYCLARLTINEKGNSLIIKK